MNYIELIKNFWHLHEEHSFSQEEIALYFYLLKSWSECNFKNPFNRNDAMTMAYLGIRNRKTFDDSINKLIQVGLIKYQEESNNTNVSYTITNALIVK